MQRHSQNETLNFNGHNVLEALMEVLIILWKLKVVTGSVVDWRCCIGFELIKM